MTKKIAHAALRRQSPARVLTGVVLAAALAGASCSARRNLGADGRRNPVTGGTESRATAGVGAPFAVSAGGSPSVAGRSAQSGSQSPASAGMPMMSDSIDQTGPDNPAGLAEADAKKLLAGGPPGKLRWLYPYEGTVFPRGTIAPPVMWQGDAATDAVYLRIKSQTFEYKGILKAGLGHGFATFLGTTGGVAALSSDGKQPQLPIPADVWAKAGALTRGKSDPFTIELSTLVGGNVAGPVVLHITIAQASIQGSVYYNTYDSTEANNVTNYFSGGKLVRIPRSGTPELVTKLSEGCYGCHSVSANGSRVIAHRSPDQTKGMPFVGEARSYQLNPTGIGDSVAVGPRGSFAALYPDGSKYLDTSLQTNIGNEQFYEPQGTPLEARLLDAATGQVIPDTGIPAGALMPSFSPDGTGLVFNDFAINTAHGLAVMKYDVVANKASGYKNLVKWDATDTFRPAFPAFVPDNNAVVFARTDGADFTTGQLASQASAAVGNSLQMRGQQLALSDLYIADMRTGTSTILAKAMGFNTLADAQDDKTTYLPFGADDLHNNYSPTILPVALGGYFWVFFDSRRNFGNLGLQRQLWCTAIDVRPDGSYTSDPSHPPFYVPGQGFGTSNHRAFAALDPCRQNGDACASGIDCCAGQCNASGVCAPPPPNSCAKREERCTSSADCCPPEPGDSDYSCIAGFCAYVPLL
jgi:hypothetical protein